MASVALFSPRLGEALRPGLQVRPTTVYKSCFSLVRVRGSRPVAPAVDSTAWKNEKELVRHGSELKSHTISTLFQRSSESGGLGVTVDNAVSGWR